MQRGRFADLSRRDFIRSGLILAASASPATASDDPRVYRDYSLRELDHALDQKIHAPNWREMLAVYERLSEEAWERHRPSLEQFGAGPEELLDFYGAGRPDGAPLLMLFHGGGWRMMGRRDVAYAASSFLDRGISFAAPSYGLLPATSIRQMADRCRRALIWVYHNADRLGIDRRRIHVGGLSAGAHLAGVLLATNWADHGLPPDAIAGGILVSGIYDLAALRASTVYGYTALEDGDIAALSPIRHANDIRATTLVAWGEHEPPEFARQSRAFVAELKRLGKPCRGIEIAGRNHFEIALDLGDPTSGLAGAALRLISAD